MTGYLSRVMGKAKLQAKKKYTRDLALVEWASGIYARIFEYTRKF
jgi:hypothetical protein